jgi:YHS domain-containing protein
MVPFAEDMAGVKMALDPVCGMAVDPDKIPFKSEYHGRKVYFCCARCKTAFDRDPAAHASSPETG